MPGYTKVLFVSSICQKVTAHISKLSNWKNLYTALLKKAQMSNFIRQLSMGLIWLYILPKFAIL